MGKRENKRRLQLCVLEKVKRCKDILFGAFSEKLTKGDKNAAWKEILDYAQSLGLIVGKDPQYMRDTWWPNIRKTTMAKKDNARRTGTGGGTDMKLNEIDDLVLDVIGKESPVVEGLGVGESTEASDRSEEEQFRNLMESIESRRPSTSESAPKNTSLDSGLNLSGVSWRKAPQKKSSTPQAGKSTSTPSPVTEEKNQLRLQLLKLQIYKTKLETRNIELSLGLPRSVYTEDIEIDLVEHDSQ